LIVIEIGKRMGITLDELGVNCLYSVRKFINNSRFEKKNKDEFLKISFDI
jgi:hypothetical protein